MTNWFIEKYPEVAEITFDNFGEAVIHYHDDPEVTMGEREFVWGSPFRDDIDLYVQQHYAAVDWFSELFGEDSK